MSHTQDWAGRVALVTGGSSGIGSGAVRALAAGGVAVAVHGLALPETEAVAAEVTAAGGRAIALAGRIDDSGTAEQAVAATLDAFGRLDILVTSAGIQRYGDAVSTSEATWDEVFDVNVKGVYLAAHAALPAIRQSPAGAVVMIASVQGSACQSNVVAYAASKGALHAMARAMCIDEGVHGVRVNTVSPGSVDTPMLRASAKEWSDGTPEGIERLVAEWGSSHPLGRVGTIAELGEAIAFLANPGAGFISGADIRVDGGLLARAAAVLPQRN